MVNKNNILILSLIINLILCYLLYSFFKSDNNKNEEFLKAEGRVYVLKNDVSEKDNEINNLQLRLDSINNLLIPIPKEREIIKIKYYEKANNIIDIPIDSSIVILSRRLSEINLNR